MFQCPVLMEAYKEVPFYLLKSHIFPVRLYMGNIIGNEISLGLSLFQ